MPDPTLLSFQYDATNSWSGYNYQGKIAVYVAIRKINMLYEASKAYSISDYYLELEWLEDFSVLYEVAGKMHYESIHQVKARADAKITDYAQALTQLVKKVQSDTDIKDAYLHTIHAIAYESGAWEASVEAVLTTEDALLDLIEQIDHKLCDAAQLDELIKTISSRGKPTSFVSSLKQEFLKQHPGQKLVKATATQATVTEALTLLRASLQDDLDICRKGVSPNDLRKIKLYTYDNPSGTADYCPLDKIDSLIEGEILRYWKNSAALPWKFSDTELVHQILLCLMGEVDKHIIHRHQAYGGSPNRRISLSDFVEVMDNDAPIVRCEEYYLYESKHRILCHCNQYHESCLQYHEATGENAPCDTCQIYDVVERIEQLPFEDLKNFIRATNPDIQAKHDLSSMDQYCAEAKYNKPFLEGLRKITQPFDPHRVPISFISKKKQLYLLTTLKDDDTFLPLQMICQRILKNIELPEIFMEYDVLLSKDLTTTSILEEAGDFMGKFHMDADNIYHFKNVQIKSIQDSLCVLNETI